MEGADFLVGGLGNDSFCFAALSDSTVDAAGRDRVGDFVHGQDVINMHEIDAVIGFEMINQDFTFIGTSGFSAGVAGQLRYSQSGGNTLVQADVNGDQVADFALLLNGNFNLAAADFIL